MNCCKNGKNNKHMHPMWMMVLCCGAPILLLLIIALLGTGFSGKIFLIGALPFICPIMMLIMMPMMLMKHNGSGDCHEQTSAESKDHETNSNDNQLK